MSSTAAEPKHHGLALAALWYFGGLLWRLKKGTAGVKPVEDLVDRNH